MKNINKIILTLGVLAIAALFFVNTSFAGTTIGSNISTDGTFTVKGNSTIGDAAQDTVTINAAPTFNTTSTFTLQGSETITVNQDLGADVAAGIAITATPNATNYSNTFGILLDQANTAAGTNGLDIGLLIQNNDTDAAITTGIALINSEGAAANFPTGVWVEDAYVGVKIIPASPVTAAPNGFGVLIQNTSLAAPTGTNFTGLLIDNLTSAGAGNENAISIGTGWDNELYFTDSSARIQLANGGNISVVDTSGNILFMISDVGPFGSILAARPIKPKTINYTVLDNESNTVLTNDGASGPITFTLPTPNAGLHYTFMNVEAQSLIIDTPATTQIVSLTSATGDSITSDTQYESITLVAHNAGSGGEWVVASCYIVGTPTTNTCFGGGTVGWADSN